MNAVALRARDPAGGREWKAAVEEVSQRLDEALAESGASRAGPGESGLRFRFQEDEVILGTDPIWELRGWEWIERLSNQGIGFMLLREPETSTALENFIIDLEAALAGEGVTLDGVHRDRWGGLRFSYVTPDASIPLSGSGGSRGAFSASPAPPRPVPEGADEIDEATHPGWVFPSGPEVEAAQRVLDRVADGGAVAVAEAEALVRTLSMGARCLPRSALRLVEDSPSGGYPAAHAVNTALLSMLLAEERGMNSREVWEVGMAGLLHDVGMTQVAGSLLERPDSLTPPERDLLNTHPRIGARILLEGPPELSIPALVAYEHHMRVDGGGYPERKGTGRPHPVSRLVHLASVYSALRADRPYSRAWTHARAVTFVRAGVGGQFDEGCTRDFLRVMERWTPRPHRPGVSPETEGRSSAESDDADRGAPS